MTTAESTGTRIHLCGRLLVQLDGERLEDALPGRQGRLLLAYLALNRGRPVRRDELLDALWPDGGGAASADSLLRPPLSRLRKALGPDRIEGRGELTLVLPDDAWVDWEVAHSSLATARSSAAAGDHRAALDAAQEAVAIAERGLLPGLETEWIEERRRELDEIRVEALEATAIAGLALGGSDLPVAERAARAAVEAAPFRESARTVLMEALAAGGNVAEAMRAFDDLRTMLREELGTTPGPRVVALYERLLRAEDEPSPPPPAPAPAPAAPTAPVQAPAAAGAAQIVERDDEVSLLLSMIGSAATGEGRVALIEGPAGIGKSMLLAEGRRQAAANGTLALAARGSELEREFPFGAVRQLFEGALADPERRARALQGSAAPAAAVFGSPGDDASPGSMDASFAALHGLFWLAVNLSAETPLFLAIDDLHWCDRPSLRFVAYLTRRLEGLPILVATTVRSGEPSADAALLAEIAQDPGTATIRPRPLTEAAVAELVRDRLGPDADNAFCQACHRVTVGNPLLLRQLLSALEADGVQPDASSASLVQDIGPGAVSRNILMRLARLGPEASSVARAVAVLGEHAELPLLAALAGLDEQRVAEATGALARAEILRPESPPGFVHPLIRDAVYHELPVGERELQHSRAAKMLADAAAPPEQVAAHLLVIPRRGEPWVAEQLQAAAVEAMAKGAGDSAVAYFERALEEAPPGDARAQVLLGLGAATALRTAPEAAVHLRRAYAEFDDPMGKAMAADPLARTLLFTDAADEAAAVASEAAAALPPEMKSQRDGLEALEITAAGYFGGGPAEVVERLHPYRTRRDWEGAGSKMLEVITALEWTYAGGPADECVAMATHALRGGELIEADPGLLGVVATLVLALADRDEAMEAWDMLLADAHRRGSLLVMSGVGLWRGFTLFRRGELAEAEELIADALEVLESYGFGSAARAYHSGFQASVLVERGKLEEAREALTRFDLPAGDRSYGMLFWKTSEAMLLAAEGRAEEAIAAADECGARWPEAVNPAISPWRSLKAVALDQLGRRDEALVLAQEELDIARGYGAPGALGRSLRVLGTLEGERGIDRLREAVEVLDPSTSRLQHAQSLADLGSALRQSARAEEAVRPLERALELAQVCAADGLADRVRAELVEAGADPGAATGPQALTATELRVAELAAMGQSDRDIAQALFVTPNTVEVQLSEVFRKLGVDSRRGLVLALATGARRAPRSVGA